MSTMQSVILILSGLIGLLGIAIGVLSLVVERRGESGADYHDTFARFLVAVAFLTSWGLLAISLTLNSR